MTQPRTVGLFLMDGTSDGRIKCSLDNWVGKVYLIPRTEVTRSKDRPELTQTGIYLLLGTDDASGDDFVYVGQAQERKNGNGVLGRVAEHLNEKDKDYFTHTIVIIDSENSFGPTEISYLENAFYNLAKDADHYGSSYAADHGRRGRGPEASDCLEHDTMQVLRQTACEHARARSATTRTSTWPTGPRCCLRL